MENTPLYNSRLLNTYLNYIKKNYVHLDVTELLKYAQVEPYQVVDEGHWFTQEQHDRFHEKLVERTGNENIAREVGKFAASSDGVGLLKQYAIGWMGPVKAYSVLGHISSRFTRSSSPKTRKLSSNSVEITVTPKEGVREKPYQCSNRMGMYESILGIFNYKLTHIKHPECIFKGGKACRYIISWEKPRSLYWKRIRNLSALILLGLSGILIYFFPFDTIIILLAISVFLLLSYIVKNVEEDELNRTINNLRELTENQIDQVDINYKNALMINEIGQAIGKKLDISAILENIMHALDQRLDYDRGMILLANAEKTKLTYASGFGLTDEQRALVQMTSFQLDKPGSRGIFVLSYWEQKPFLVDDINQLKDTISPRSMEFLKRMGSRAFVCCPIIYENESLGVLVVDNMEKKRQLTQTDISLLTGIAPQIGISIHNAMLVERQKKQFNSVLRVLAASIDARDPLTAGHSEKVTEYSVEIAKEMGLGEDYCELIGIAGLLHDYGKIGVRDDVLKKPGQLTDEEYTEIRSHVSQTRRILEQMEFEGIFNQIPSIAGFHHEKVDGSGYPMGLKGEEIPLGARIIAVADVFEALTAERHYRQPMRNEDALEIIQKGSGNAFDPQVVEAFNRYYHNHIGNSG